MSIRIQVACSLSCRHIYASSSSSMMVKEIKRVGEKKRGELCAALYSRQNVIGIGSTKTDREESSSHDVIARESGNHDITQIH